jgi:succinyl-CoA synthetase alpha subunit
MSILVDGNTRLMVQGITGRDGSFHAMRCRDYGTNLVAGVTPGKGGTDVEGVPVYNSVSQAVAETGANVALIFVPAPFAADAILESADAGVPLIIAITEGLPVLDMVNVGKYLKDKPVRLIGPNCPGAISPGSKAKVGIMPGNIHMAGRVGIVSRSGTLTYEAVAQLTELGIGQSTCVGIGGDPIIGSDFVQILGLFQEDDETEAIVMIGEIGGSREQEAAAFIKSNVTKPVVSFIGGATAPPGRRMGHAGAIITGESGTAKAKAQALSDAGATIAYSPAEIGLTMQKVLNSR